MPRVPNMATCPDAEMYIFGGTNRESEREREREC